MTNWTDVLAAAQLPAGGRWLARREGREIALFNVGGTLYAIDDSCPHNGASLASGRIEGTTVACRAHGLRFDLGSGSMRGGGLQVRTYPVRVHEGRIEIDLEPAA